MLIPKPNGRCEKRDGAFGFDDAVRVDTGDFAPQCLMAFLRRRHLLARQDGVGMLRLARDVALAEEAYCLTVAEDGIEVRAGSEKGVIWALTSLYLLEQNGKVPCLVLQDAPHYTSRGLLLDSARHFIQADEIKKIVEQMGLCKLNTLHWHLSDDQSWRLPVKAYPELCGFDGQPFYTEDEVRDIVAFAGQCGVEVVPELDMPGHMLGAIAPYPHLSCKEESVTLGKNGGFYSTILCAGKESTYEFLYTVLDEACDLFPGRWFHIGGDEVSKEAWEECPHCKEALRENGLADCEALQGHLMNKMAAHLQSRGKKVMCWNDALRAGNISPRDFAVQSWLATAEDSPIPAFMDAGGSVLFSNMFYNYLDYPHALNTLEKVYENSFAVGGRDFAQSPSAMGLQGCLWSEHINTEEKLETLAFPRALALAEAGWSEKKDYGDFKRRLNAHLTQLEMAGVRYTPAQGWDPKGEVRRQGATAFFENMMAAVPTGDGNSSEVGSEDFKAYMRLFVDGFFAPEERPYYAKLLLGE